MVKDMIRVVSLCFALIAATAAAAQSPSTPNSHLEAIKSSKTVKIAYREDATPFSFVNPNKEVAGFTIDICKLVVKSIAQQLGLGDLKIEWVPVTVQTRFSSIAAGKADMECGSSTVTLARMKEVDFSSFVFVESTGMLVLKASNIRSFAEMGGKKIAFISGTTNEKAIKDQIKQKNIDATVIPVKSRAEGVDAVETGKVDGFASDKLLLVGAHMKHPDAMTMLPDDLSTEPYAIALPRGDWAFRLAVNTGLAQIYRSGQIATIFRRWFDQIGLRMGPVMLVIYGLGALSD
jgi:glutamate/aspartate transport system substrate-binding protein